MKRRALSVLIGSLASVGISSAPAHAVCGAVFEASESSIIDDALARSDLAFVGTVTSTTSPSDRARLTAGVITFQVIDVWKGEAAKTATLQFRFGEDDDVQTALPGQTWLIFVVDGFAAGVCGGESRRWSDDLAVFRPAGAHPPSDPARHRVFVFVILIGAIALGLVAIVAIERRRQARRATDHLGITR